jgi:hypothetical protein
MDKSSWWEIWDIQAIDVKAWPRYSPWGWIIGNSTQCELKVLVPDGSMGMPPRWKATGAAWAQEVGWDDAEEQERKLQAVLGSPAKFEILPFLYRPELAHEELPEDDEEYNVHRVRIGGVVVRYVEDMFHVQVTVEGDLPADGIEEIRRDLIGKLQALEQAPITYRVIPPA